MYISERKSIKKLAHEPKIKLLHLPGGILQTVAGCQP